MATAKAIFAVVYKGPRFSINVQFNKKWCFEEFMTFT